MKHIKTNVGISSPFPIAMVVSQFNRDITQALQEGSIERLKERSFPLEMITLVEVPGAVEIPITAKQLAKKKQYEAIIVLGAIIRGETTHYDYVCQQVSEGCQRVALDYEVPVIFGVLTTENEAQAWDRVGGEHGHKGKDAVDCAIAMREILREINN